MARYKYNTLLTCTLVDDEGWRIEIKVFPELTKVAHGGFSALVAGTL